MTEDGVVDVDVDPETAKGYGDQAMNEGRYQDAIAHYQDAYSRSGDAELQFKLHYNMASAHFQLGDQAGCRQHAEPACWSPTHDHAVGALYLFFWSVTGHTLPNTH